MLPNLTLYFVGCTIAFLVMFKVTEVVVPNLMAVVDPKFDMLKEKSKKEYYSRVISNVHATIAVAMSVYGVWFVCEDGQSIFSSDECLVTPQKVNVYLTVLSSAYCFYDMYVVLYEINYSKKEQAEFIYHHVVGIAGALFSVALGRQNPPLSAAVLVSEISNFAMNCRWFMLKHDLADHALFMPVNFVFMLTFFLTRVVFMLLILIRNAHAHTLFGLTDQGPVFMFMQAATDTLLFALYLLQLWWFWGIAKVVYKTVIGQGDAARQETTVETAPDSQKKN